ncbi:MAG: adenosine kinase [Balneolales bacterium]|nr:adenosine kinase [Balneolales bacterium]
MKKYNVFGIGNALVDLEFDVDETFLLNNEVQKGVMTLVDGERQQNLINSMVQELSKKQSGGSAANSMMAITQLGGKTFYSCKVANDEYGDSFLLDFKNAGIDTNLDAIVREEGRTGTCLVMITSDADRTMNTFLGITEILSTKEVSEGAIKDSEYIYMEGYPVTSETGFEALKLSKKIAEENGVKTSMTLSDPTIVKFFKPRFQELIGASVDLLFCNEEEAMEFTGKSNLEEAREALKKEARRFAITLGRNGAMIYDGDTFIDIEPYEVMALNTNGAGDMFAGAFLYGITNGMTYAGAGKLASLASSRICAQYGPRLEWHEVQELKNRLS